jgi:hypothetical protein
MSFPDIQKTQDQLAMLHILVLGRKQIEQGKCIRHADVVALLESEDNESRLHESKIRG